MNQIIPANHPFFKFLNILFSKTNMSLENGVNPNIIRLIEKSKVAKIWTIVNSFNRKNKPIPIITRQTIDVTIGFSHVGFVALI